MESLPVYIPIVFVMTTLATSGFLLRASFAEGGLSQSSGPVKILYWVIIPWAILQQLLAKDGFYQDASSVPPRLVLFGVFPAVLFIIAYFIFFSSSFIEILPLKTLTLLHVVRIPVEIVLWWLFVGGQIPQIMTFEGRNFDILSGILAPIVYLIAFRGGTVNKPVLIAYNILGLLLLANIVIIAALSVQSPMQHMAFDQPNRAVLFFPYIWLPTIVVPIVLFSHLASLWKLAKGSIG